MGGEIAQAKMSISEAVGLYQVQHCGRRPAKIFVSDKLFCEMVKSYALIFHAEPPGRCTLCGVDVACFDSDKSEYYLSWEAEA